MYDRGLLLSGMLAGGLLLTGGVAAAEPQQVWQATGLDGPESAVLDAAQGVIYVSNVNGDASAASHGTLNGYDQQVPVILMGPGIKGGRYTGEASPADIVPTLAAVLGLKLTGIDGKALMQASP